MNNNDNDNIISCEEIGDFMNYTCNISKSYIVFEKNNDTKSISINNSKLDWDEPKLAINLLNYSLNDIRKNIDIHYFIHTIIKDEEKLLDMTKWQIIKDDNIILELKCNINDCVENVLHGFVHNL